MEIADQFSYLEKVHYSPRAGVKHKSCRDANCPLLLRNKKGMFYCASQKLPPRSQVHWTASVPEWIRTPQCPSGMKWTKVRRELPKRRRLSAVDECPEGRWRD